MPDQIEAIEDLIVDYMRHTHGDPLARRLLRERVTNPVATHAHLNAVVDVLQAYLKVYPPLFAGTVRHFGLDVPAGIPAHACAQSIVKHGASVFVRFHEWHEELAG